MTSFVFGEVLLIVPAVQDGGVFATVYVKIELCAEYPKVSFAVNLNPTVFPLVKVLVTLGEKLPVVTVPVKFVEEKFMNVPDRLCSAQIELNDVASVNFADGFTTKFSFGAELFIAVESEVGGEVSGGGGCIP